MNPRLAGVPLALCAALATCSRERPAGTAKESAIVELTQPHAAAIARIILSPEAHARLGVRVVATRRESVARARVLAGFVERAPDAEITSRAPFAGIVRAGEGGLPRAGASVRSGQELLWLEPCLSPSESAQLEKLEEQLALARANAAGALRRAEARHEATRVAFERSQALLEQDAGSARARDEARGEHELAAAELASAQALHGLLSATNGGSKGSDTPPRIPILAGDDAQVLDVAVAAGQVVESGAALTTLARRVPLWLRVPVFVGDLESLLAEHDVRVSGGVGELASESRVAHPIAAPPSANASAASVDLWYSFEGNDDGLRPGLRVEVTLPLRGDEQALGVPWSAVLYDARGSSWVFVRVGEFAYERRHVEIERRAGNLALIGGGLAEGSEVVVEAAAELFGVEFGAGE